MEIVALLVAAFLQLASLSLDQLRETIEAIKTALVQQYVDATEGARLGRALGDELGRGPLANAGDPDAFAAAVQKFLQTESRDRHLLVWRGSPVDILKITPSGRLQGPAVGRTEKRADNVATRTHPLTRALRGRADSIEVWTRDEVPGPRLPGVPVYVVTSADTFSAGEAFAFALQKTGRATIVGGPTGGGGYSGTFARLPNGFTMFVSTGRTFDPRTGKGWQVDSVRPDREVAAADALEAALRLASDAK
jgi:hypothetical protein